jgi:WD40 repeat protein
LTSTLGAQSQTPEQAVVLVAALEPRKPPATGFLISPDGYILTAAHVVCGSTKFRVRLEGDASPRDDPQQWREASLVPIEGVQNPLISRDLIEAPRTQNSPVMVPAPIELQRPDGTLPRTQVSLSPQPKTQGWNNIDMMVRFNCQDALSGIVSCTLQKEWGSSEVERKIEGRAKDRVGNFSQTFSATIHLTVSTLSGHTNWVRSVAFSPNGQFLASGSWDTTIKLWDVAGGREVRTLTGHTDWVNSVAFSPNGQFLASGSWDTTIKLWEVASGREVRTLTGHTDWVNSVAFNPDGQFLASGSDDKTIKLWEVASGREVRTLTGHTDWVNSVAFSPDGRLLASGSCGKFDSHGNCIQGEVKLWEVTSGREVRTLTGHTDWVNSVAFSPNGQFLASGSDDKTIKLWDVATGSLVRTLAGHSSIVTSVAFSPNGQFLASGSWDTTIKLWKVTNGMEVRTLTGHTGWVLSVAFSPDGQLLASGSGDKTIKLWDISDLAGR